MVVVVVAGRRGHIRYSRSACLQLRRNGFVNGHQYSLEPQWHRRPPRRCKPRMAPVWPLSLCPKTVSHALPIEEKPAPPLLPPSPPQTLRGKRDYSPPPVLFATPSDRNIRDLFAPHYWSGRQNKVRRSDKTNKKKPEKRCNRVFSPVSTCFHPFRLRVTGVRLGLRPCFHQPGRAQNENSPTQGRSVKT